jgi:hypothetical protein
MRFGGEIAARGHRRGGERAAMSALPLTSRDAGA